MCTTLYNLTRTFESQSFLMCKCVGYKHLHFLEPQEQYPYRIYRYIDMYIYIYTYVYMSIGEERHSQLVETSKIFQSWYAKCQESAKISRIGPRPKQVELLSAQQLHRQGGQPPCKAQETTRGPACLASFHIIAMNCIWHLGQTSWSLCTISSTIKIKWPSG